jgi:nucleotide-binding universal stress UspA family protein
MTYQKILVALDQSKYSEAVFQQALNMADKEKTTLMLFHCLSVDGNATPYTNLYGQELTSFSLSDYLEEEIKSVEKWLTDYVQQAQEQGIKCEYLWKIGEPSSWVREIAKSWQADLVILGRRGLSGLAEFFLGSVSNHVLHHVNCSVLIVQETKNSK